MKKFLFLSAVLGLAAAVPFAQAESIFGLVAPSASTSQIITFDSNSPSVFTTSPLISGLNSGDVLMDIDVRPLNNVLYGIANSGNLYTINPVTGVATFNAAPASSVGTATSVDFNPVADRLRIISLNTAINLGGVNPGQLNFRLTPGTGVVSTDGTLSYAVGDINAGFADRPNIVGSAYTNSFAGATTTTLYGLDNVVGPFGTQGFLVMHTGSPQFNSLSTVAALTLNGQPFDLADNTGFDISGATGFAYVTISNTNNLAPLGDFLFRLNLATGQLTALGSGPINAQGVLNLEAIAVAVPEPGSVVLTLLGGALALGVGVRRRRNATV